MTTNDATRATAEGMPASRDPLLDAIQAWHAGNAAYDNHPIVKTLGYTDEEEEAAVAATYGPADQVLQEWSKPATTYAGAIEALRVARQEAIDCGMSSSEVLNNMIEAALGFFEDRSEGELSKLLDAHAQITGAINAHEGDSDHPEVVGLCKQHVQLTLAICSYRPRTEHEQRRKAEFLRDWTANSLLTEEEQNALIASLMPEGGDA